MHKLRRLPSPKVLAVLASVLAFPVIAAAHSVQSGNVMIGHIWAYPAQTSIKIAGTDSYGRPLHAGGYTVDIYGSLLNKGGLQEALTGVSSSAKTTHIVMWVRGTQIATDFPLTLPPGKPVALGPQTQFLRLSGVGKTYGSGDHFPITLYFQHAPPATIDVIVQRK